MDLFQRFIYSVGVFHFLRLKHYRFDWLKRNEQLMALFQCSLTALPFFIFFGLRSLKPNERFVYSVAICSLAAEWLTGRINLTVPLKRNERLMDLFQWFIYSVAIIRGWLNGAHPRRIGSCCFDRVYSSNRCVVLTSMGLFASASCFCLYWPIKLDGGHRIWMCSVAVLVSRCVVVSSCEFLWSWDVSNLTRNRPNLGLIGSKFGQKSSEH